MPSESPSSVPTRQPTSQPTSEPSFSPTMSIRIIVQYNSSIEVSITPSENATDEEMYTEEIFRESIENSYEDATYEHSVTHISVTSTNNTSNRRHLQTTGLILLLVSWAVQFVMPDSEASDTSIQSFVDESGTIFDTNINTGAFAATLNDAFDGAINISFANFQTYDHVVTAVTNFPPTSTPTESPQSEGISPLIYLSVLAALACIVPLSYYYFSRKAEKGNKLRRMYEDEEYSVDNEMPGIDLHVKPGMNDLDPNDPGYKDRFKTELRAMINNIYNTDSIPTKSRHAMMLALIDSSRLLTPDEVNEMLDYAQQLMDAKGIKERVPKRQFFADPKFARRDLDSHPQSPPSSKPRSHSGSGRATPARVAAGDTRDVLHEASIRLEDMYSGVDGKDHLFGENIWASPARESPLRREMSTPTQKPKDGDAGPLQALRSTYSSFRFEKLYEDETLKAISWDADAQLSMKDRDALTRQMEVSASTRLAAANALLPTQSAQGFHFDAVHEDEGKHQSADLQRHSGSNAHAGHAALTVAFPTTLAADDSFNYLETERMGDSFHAGKKPTALVDMREAYGSTKPNAAAGSAIKGGNAHANDPFLRSSQAAGASLDPFSNADPFVKHDTALIDFDSGFTGSQPQPQHQMSVDVFQNPMAGASVRRASAASAPANPSIAAAGRQDTGKIVDFAGGARGHPGSSADGSADAQWNPDLEWGMTKAPSPAQPNPFDGFGLPGAQPNDLVVEDLESARRSTTAQRETTSTTAQRETTLKIGKDTKKLTYGRKNP